MGCGGVTRRLRDLVAQMELSRWVVTEIVEDCEQIFMDWVCGESRKKGTTELQSCRCVLLHLISIEREGEVKLTSQTASETDIAGSYHTPLRAFTACLRTPRSLHIFQTEFLRYRLPLRFFTQFSHPTHYRLITILSQAITSARCNSVDATRS